MTSSDDTVQTNPSGRYSGLLLFGEDGQYYFLMDNLYMSAYPDVDFIIPSECASVATPYFISGQPCKIVRTTFDDPYDNGGRPPDIELPGEDFVQLRGSIVQDGLKQRLSFVPQEILQYIRLGATNRERADSEINNQPWLKSVYATVNACQDNQTCIDTGCLPRSAVTCVVTAVDPANP